MIARNSSFAFRGQAVGVSEVGEQLGVRYLLEGSVRRAGNRVRITAQLLDIATGSHVWAERYDRDLEDIFALQEEITRNVVGSIAPQIEMAEMERSHRMSARGLSSYEQSLKAQALTYDALRVGDVKELEKAIAVAHAALEINDRDTLALWIAAFGYVYLHLYGWGSGVGEPLVEAKDLADRLIRVDPAYARGYMTRATVFIFEREFAAAMDDFQRAYSLNPNLAQNLILMAWGESLAGLATEAREHAHLALRLSPRDSDLWVSEAYLALSQAALAEGDFVECQEWARRCLQLHSKLPLRQTMMIASSGHLGDSDRARRHISELATIAPSFLAEVLSGEIKPFRHPEHNEILVEGLRKATEN